MFQKYFDDNKHTFFKDIKDFTKDYNNIRKKNIHKMTWQEWFWFDTSAYKLMYYGNLVGAVIIYGLLARIFFSKEVIALGLVMSILTLMMILGLFNKIKNRYQIETMTFYDHYLKEY